MNSATSVELPRTSYPSHPGLARYNARRFGPGATSSIPRRTTASRGGRSITTHGDRTMKTYGSAIWQGRNKDRKGAISTRSGAIKDCPYGFSSRFEGKPGTNPEELIGAAHAGCFTMALSLI